MRTVAIIPARFGSTRLPGKPLLNQTGQYLIQHVVEQVRKASRLDGVYVATDDPRIFGAVKSFGGEPIMTRGDHASGTDRLAEAANKIGLGDDDIVVNVQGDEPEMNPAYIDSLVDLLTETNSPMATLAAPLDAKRAENPNSVKVVVAANRLAMYFSRAKIPFDRDNQGAGYLLHLGIYAYRKSFLVRFATLKPTPCERTEKLEQLRALENGHAIAVAVVESAKPGIDTPEDYAAFVQRFGARKA